jgi:hypothetical protein
MKLFYFCLLCVSISCISCEKETVQGPKGDPGTPGGGGNAGITASDVFTVSTTQWQTTVDSSYWKFSIFSGLITQEVLDKGVLKVFVQRGTFWWELPYTEGDLFTQCGFELGQANLFFTDIHGGLPDRPVTSAYRVIAISAVARAKNPDVNWSNYSEISKLLNSPDSAE